ncbi:aminodeoxychorismate synthase, component I [Planococcus salinarum]|uniref:Aminodeoxychorismate synthase, component I n=1 Tax=Planococcus salinarum TaxID=622695 RepID=A0ABX3D127_9BACL|nr:aminodeoxychorismate synthase component I [Planococcus salinarum]OHX53267.1 aminodeoxychorismate synthase, component I [Planococcus salinarum]TAA73344.1 aminodeoxychorismate synthase component I [Planococcus salinarum]
MDNPYLLFEFRNADGIVEPLAFSNPVRILQTHNIGEVAGILKQLDEAADQGYYAAGFVSYEAAPAFNAAMEVRPAGDFPLVWFGIFEKPHHPEPTGLAESSGPTDYHVSDWQMAGTPEAYKEGIRKIKQAIEEGDTYQVNYTERLHADFRGSDAAFYRQLARNQQAGYGAYLNIGNQRILSASPELFFRVDNGRLTTKPMKGTAARGRTLEEDKERIAELLASEKEQAENLMIVDLLRNDMSRLAKKGTVKVDRLFEVETYPTVHQMTSTIEAELAPELDILDWFKALFPCGSITGAPKISTMHTIAELEATPREAYCGAIGFVTPDKNAVFNVPIRTVIIDANEGTARYGVGGGVTWDSTSEGEFRELQTKAEVLTARRPAFQLLESLKLENGHYPLLAYHMTRLVESAAYFSFPADRSSIGDHLSRIAAENPAGSYKVRLLLDRDGNISIEAQETAAIAEPVKCALAAAPVDSGNAFLYHKTTYRQVYEEAVEKKPPEAFSVLLWNENEELTEFAIGNVVVEKDGEFFTPPVSCGLLPGTFRQQLLDAGEITEKILRKEELGEWDAVWFINSVRGWLRVEMI